MMNRAALRIVIALILVSAVIAEGQTLEQFNQNPNPESFQQLTEADQLTYLGQNYREDLAEKFYQTASNVGKNPAVDQQYFSKIDNIGKNPDADDAFFSGGNVFETSRVNIAANKASASKYFTAKYSTTYIIEQVEDDFTFDINLGTLTNGGKTIPFSLFKDKLSIKNIRTVAGGIIIEEEKHKTELTGIGKAEIKTYNPETGSVEMAVGENPLTFTRKTGKDLMIEVDGDSNLRLSGTTSGKIIREGKEIRFQNREGALFISADGKTITADDALVDTSELHLDGRFSVSGETITLNSYSGKNSLVVDKKTSLGIESQGQSRDAGEAVTVHFGEINKDGTITGKNAEVWIKADQPELFVFAQGKVKVSKYITSPDGTPLAESTVSPRFTGEEASARFDFHSQSKVEKFSLSGQALYEDYFVKIDNIQDGSEVLKKQPSPDPKSIDLFEVKCSGCEGEEVTKIIKKVTAIHQTESVAEISGRTFVPDSAAKDITITFKQTADGIVPEPDKKMLGELAAQLGDDGVLSISTGMLIQTEGDNFFGITPNGIGKYERENSNLKLSEAAIDLKVRQSTGNEIVYVNDDEYDKVSQFISALEDKDFARADELGKELSPATKSVLEKELGINVNLLGDSGYSSHLSTGMEETSGEGKSKVFAEKLRERGVNIDNLGKCVDDVCTEAVRKALRSGDAKAHLYLALLNSLDKGQIELLEAQKAAMGAEEKSTKEIDVEISRLKDNIKQRSEDKKRFNANYEPQSTVSFFEVMQQVSAEVTQTISEMSETAAIEQAQRIEFGEINPYEKAIIQEAEELRTKKVLTEQQLKFHQGRLELAQEQYEQARKEIQSEVSQSASQYAGTSSVTTEKKLSALEQRFKAEKDKITQDIKQKEDNLKGINLKRDELVEQLPDRPDLQAQVYREFGDHAEETGKRMATVALLTGAGIQVDQSQARHMLAVSLAEAGDEEAAIQVAQESGRSDSEAVVSSVINGRKAAPLVELEADLESADIRHKWERKITRDEISWVDPALSPLSTLTDVSGEIKRKQAEEDMNYITQSQLDVAAARRAVSAGGEVPKNDFTTSSSFKQMMGEQLTPDEKLGALLDQAKLLHHTKGIGAAEPIYRQIATEAPDSAQAYYAQNQLEMKSLATTVEYSELAADLVIDIPLAIGASMGIAKLTTKAAKAGALARILSKAEKVADITGDIAKTVSNAPEAAKVLPEVEKIAESSRKIEKLAEESSELGKIGDKIKSCGVKCHDEIIEAAKSAKLDDAVSAGEKAVAKAGDAPEQLEKAQQQALAGIQRAAQKKAVAHSQEMAAHADELQQSVKVLDEAVAVGDAPLAKVGEQVRVLAEEARGMAGAVKVQQAVSTPVRVAAGLKKIKTAIVGEKAVQEAVEDTSKLAKSAQKVDNDVAQGVGKGGLGIIAPVDIDVTVKNLKASINAAKKSGDSNALSGIEHYLAEPAVLKAFREAGKEGELLKLQKSLGVKSGAVEKVLGKAKPKKVMPQSTIETAVHLEAVPTTTTSKLPNLEERIADSSTLKILAEESPSGSLSKSALKDKQLQQKVLAGVVEKAKSSNSVEARNILERYNKLSKQAERGEEVIIPKYYHATEKEGLEGIISSRKIEVRAQQVQKGAFVSSVPEVVSYGDYVIVFGSDLETMPGKVNRLDNRIWKGVEESIPVTQNSIAYVIVKDEEMVGPTLKMLKSKGFKNTPVITLKEAEMEREMILQSRITSPDRANVILEGGLKLKSTSKTSLLSKYNPEKGMADNLNQIIHSFRNGDVLELPMHTEKGGYGYITKNEKGEVFFNTIDPTTREPIPIQLVALRDESYKVAKAKGLEPSEVWSMEDLIISEKNGFLGIRVNPTQAEGRIFEALANGEFSPVSYFLDEVPDVAKVGEEQYMAFFKAKTPLEVGEFARGYQPVLAKAVTELSDLTTDLHAELRAKGFIDEAGDILDPITGEKVKLVSARIDLGTGLPAVKDDFKIEEKIFRDLTESEGAWKAFDAGKAKTGGKFPRGTTIEDARRMVLSAAPNDPIALRDIAGTRITVSALEEESEALKLIEQKYGDRIIGRKDFLGKDYRNDGYRSIHVIIDVDGKPVEIQIRTPTQTRWADWTHETVYKGAYKSDPVATSYARDVGDWLHRQELGNCPPPCEIPVCPGALKVAGICFGG